MTAMDHGSAHERIEDLLLDPARLAGLPSSTDPADVALREHVAGCAACRADLDGWARLQDAVTDALATTSPAAAASLVEPMEPPASLRSRVLAAVHAEHEAALAPVPMATAATAATAARRSWFAQPRTAWLGLAAALVVLVVSGGLLVDQAGRLAASRAEADNLADAMAAVDRVLSGEHTVVPLRTTAGVQAGSISWSRHDWVVLTTALAAPPPGQEYLCWLESDGKSVPIGRMEFVEGTAYWVATVDAWKTWEIGTTTQFVVSLETGSPASRTGDAILAANLGT